MYQAKNRLTACVNTKPTIGVEKKIEALKIELDLEPKKVTYLRRSRELDLKKMKERSSSQDSETSMIYRHHQITDIRIQRVTLQSLSQFQ